MIGTTFADRYQIKRLLGQSQNEVWLVYDTNQRQEVALKTFRPGYPSIHAYGEASILTALEGEHVLRVYNADTFADIPYIAMQVAAMGTAEDLRKANRFGLPAATVISWIRQALVGLGACHDRGLLHRDIKPDNIFLQSAEFAQLGDFGLAHQVDAYGMAPAEGTPHIISPEMWTGGQGSYPSDIYSMGVTAYRLLTGRWPYELRSRDEARAIVPSGRFFRVRDVAPHLPRRLADRIEKAIALDPSDRYPSWRAMHVDLGRPDLVDQAWRPQSPHPGHARCWTEVRRSSSPRQVCLSAASGQFNVEVRYATGSNRRLSGLCRYGLVEDRLAIELRRVFDALFSP